MEWDTYDYDQRSHGETAALVMGVAALVMGVARTATLVLTRPTRIYGSAPQSTEHSG